MNLITENQIKDLTAISSNVDVKFIMPYVPIAQERHFKPLLGEVLFNELNGVDYSGQTESNQQLLDKVYPALAWSTYYEASPFQLFKTTNKGFVKQSSTDSETITLEELEFLRREIRETMDFYLGEIEKFLVKNKDSFPSFRAEENSSQPDTNNYNDNIGWY